jgi:RNA polymerase sigma-70 factor (ECF subfamily)
VTALAATAIPAAEQDRALRFRRVFESEFAYVWTSLRRLGVAPRDLEDVAHDVLLCVYQSFDRYDPERPLRPWLFAFAFRFASDYRRLARHRVERMGEAIDAPSHAALPDEVASSNEARALIARALESVPIERRAVFILFELDERKMTEIAESLEIPLHTAYSRLRVAREEFRSALERLKRGSR